MSTPISFENFEKIYHKTYKNILRYIIAHCNNLDDVNDIIQDTYMEFYKKIKKNKRIEIEDEQAFIIGIAKNMLKKYYRFQYKEKSNVVILENEELPIEDNIDLELQFITKENVSYIWKMLNNKDIQIVKIFYLHYVLDMKIVDIAKEMNLTESATKNYIYRTIKELKNGLKESEKNA
ncbi:MAG: RNA polymerase sigma factor [Clostridia bacterium]|nr:RNA polymerase sigma factor [Clostridia bacterium]